MTILVILIGTAVLLIISFKGAMTCMLTGICRKNGMRITPRDEQSETRARHAVLASLIGMAASAAVFLAGFSGFRYPFLALMFGLALGSLAGWLTGKSPLHRPSPKPMQERQSSRRAAAPNRRAAGTRFPKQAQSAKSPRYDYKKEEI